MPSIQAELPHATAELVAYEAKLKREAEDQRLMKILCNQPDLYSKESWEPIIRIPGWLAPMSLRWMLYYRQARMFGISCMLSSAHYAFGRMIKGGCFCYEHAAESHRIQDQAIDHAILYRAQQRVDELRRAKQEKGQQ